MEDLLPNPGEDRVSVIIVVSPIGTVARAATAGSQSHQVSGGAFPGP
ncbi:MAG: hypothetical protein ACTHV7_09835 [Oleiphilaceae bacterium]